MSSEPTDPPLRHMNVFVPYERRAHHHEDNLTRAFVLVLSGVPIEARFREQFVQPLIERLVRFLRQLT